MLMTAKSARKSPKTETTCAYQRRRIMGMRITSPIESGAGSSGSMGGFGIDSAGAGLGEVVLMRGEFMVLDRGSDQGLCLASFHCGSPLSGHGITSQAQESTVTNFVSVWGVY